MCSASCPDAQAWLPATMPMTVSSSSSHTGHCPSWSKLPLEAARPRRPPLRSSGLLTSHSPAAPTAALNAEKRSRALLSEGESADSYDQAAIELLGRSRTQAGLAAHPP